MNDMRDGWVWPGPVGVSGEAKPDPRWTEDWSRVTRKDSYSLDGRLAQRARRDNPRLPRGCRPPMSDELTDTLFNQLWVEDLVRLFADSWSEGERSGGVSFSRAFGAFQRNPRKQGWESAFPRCWTRARRTRIKNRLGELFRAMRDMTRRLAWYLRFIESPIGQEPIRLAGPADWPTEELFDLMRESIGEERWRAVLEERESGAENRRREQSRDVSAAIARLKRGMEQLYDRRERAAADDLDDPLGTTHETYNAVNGFLSSYRDRVVEQVEQRRVETLPQLRPDIRGARTMPRSEQSLVAGADYADTVWSGIEERQRSALLREPHAHELVNTELRQFQIELIRRLYRAHGYSGRVTAETLVGD